MTKPAVDKPVRPAILSKKPRFLRPNPAELNHAVEESLEAIFLQGILRMQGREIGIYQPKQTEKFKSVTVALVHQLFFYRQAWEIKYRKFILDLISTESRILTRSYFGCKSFLSFLLILKECENLSYLPNSQILPSVEFLTECVEKQHADKMDLFICRDQIAAEMERVAFQNKVVNAGAYFNLHNQIAEIEILRKISTSIKDIYTNKLTGYSLGQAFMVDLTNLHKQYMNSINNYFIAVANTQFEIENFIPDFTQEHFNKSYQNVIYNITKELNNGVLRFLVELHLRQIRHPEQQIQLNALLQDTYLPMTNGITIERVANHTIPTFSLQQMLADAYAIKPVLITPLITVMQTKILIQQSLCYQEYNSAFAKFSTHSNGNIDREDRTQAKDAFMKKLAAATTLENIAVLLATAQASINRPRNYMLSTNTATWLRLQTEAREKGLELLQGSAEKNAHCSTELYRYWKQQTLFAAPLTLSEQLFGMTEAQAQISQLQTRKPC